MNFRLLTPILIVGGLIVGMPLAVEVGRRIGARGGGAESGKTQPGLGPIQGAAFSLLGLLLAFTLNGAASRFDSRRMLIVDEANAIGTAYLRVDLLAPSAQPAIRDLFRRYLDSRLAAERSLPDLQAALAAIAEAERLQGEIWTRVLAATHLADSHADAAKLLIPTLNQMFDTSSTRTMSARAHPPPSIFGLLFGLSLLCSLLAGFGMAKGRRRSLLHTIGFTLSTAAVVYIILEVEYPRFGLIRISDFDTVLTDLRAKMN